MKWLDNSPADRKPEEVRKNDRRILLLVITINAVMFLIFTLHDSFYYGHLDMMLPILGLLFFEVPPIFALYMVNHMQENHSLPKYISFSDKGVHWKTKGGEEGVVEYSKIKSIMRTARKTIMGRNRIPLKENIYTVTYGIKSILHSEPSPSQRDFLLYLPTGLLMNKENTKILIEKLKEIDPELKNVEISGWNEMSER